MKKVLVLTDGKAGHENQSRAFVRALGCEACVVPVKFKSAGAKALSYLLDKIGVRTGRLFKGLDDATLRNAAGDGGAAPGFSAVVGTGSGTFYAAKAVARMLGIPCGVILYPRGYDMASFDCIMAPSFDNPALAPNVVEIPANIVANDDGFYSAGVDRFREHYESVNGRPCDMSRRAVAVVVGGPNKCSTMTPEWMREKLDEAFAAAEGRAMWVTTSRRTPPEVESVVDSFPWDYKLLYSKDHFNPIPAFVKLADRIYVTAESTGMLSEACTCGSSEVVALDNLNPGPHKFRRFVEGLVRDGYVGGRRKVDLSSQFAMAKTLLGL